MDVREDNSTETIKDSLLNARFLGVTVGMPPELHSEYALIELEPTCMN